MRRFVVDGPPVGKGRPKVGNGHGYTPKKTRAYESLVKLEYARQVGLQPLEKGVPVAVSIVAHFPIPKATTKKNRPLMLEGRILPTKKPDYDNIAKIVTDALNGLAYYDDAQVVQAVVHKRYSESPRVEVTVEEIKMVEETDGRTDRLL